MILRGLRRYPATIAATAAVSIGFVLQWFLPIEALLERDPAAISDGQWWRVLSSVLVQGSGWGQFLFNTLGLILVGAAVERTRGSAQWAIAALVAQVGASLCSIWWTPAVNDSGCSLVVGGLVGLLSVTRFLRPAGWVAGSAAYRVFFVSYLAGLSVAGPLVGAVVGSVLAGVATSLLLRSSWASWCLTVVLVIVIVGSTVLVAAQDQHGAAVLLGLIVGAISGPAETVGSAGRVGADLRPQS